MQREITFIKIKCIVKIFISFWRLWAKKNPFCCWYMVSSLLASRLLTMAWENPSYYIKVACYGIWKGWKLSYQFIIQKIKNFVLSVIKFTVYYLKFKFSYL